MTNDDKKKKPKKVGYPFTKVDNPFYVKLDKKLPDLNKSFEEKTARQQAEQFKKDSQEYINNPLKHLQENPLSLNAKPLIDMQEPLTPEAQREANVRGRGLERGTADYKYVKPPEFTRNEEEQQNYDPIGDLKTLVTDATDALKTINFWVGDSVNGVPTPKITATNYATAIPDLFRAGATLLAMPFNAGLEFVNSNPEARPITKLLMGIMESASYLPKLEYNYIMDLADKNGVTPLLKPFGIEDNRTITDILKEGADVIGVDEPQFNNLRKFVNEVIDFGSQTALFVGGSGLLKGLKKPEYYERMNVEGEPIRRRRTEGVNIEDANYQDIPPEGQKQLPEYIERVKTEDAGFAEPDKSNISDARYVDLPPDNVMDMGERMAIDMIKTDIMMLNRDRNNMSLQIREPNINPKERLGLIETRDRIDQKISELETKLIESKKPEIKNDQIVPTGKNEFIEKVKTEDAGFAKPDKSNISDAKFKDLPPDDFTGDPTTDLPEVKPPPKPSAPAGESAKLLPKAEIRQPVLRMPSEYTVVKEIPKNKSGLDRIEHKKYPVVTYSSPIFKNYILPKRTVLSMAMPPEPPANEAGFDNRNSALVSYKEKPSVKTEQPVATVNPDADNLKKVAMSKKLERLGVTDKWEQTAIDKGLINIQHARQKAIKPKLDELFKKARDGHYSLSKEGNGLLPYMYNQSVAAILQHNPEAVINKADILEKIDTPMTKSRVMEAVRESQQNNIEQWADYLENQGDYNDAFKISLFNEVLTKYYNYDKQKIIVRGNTTLTEIPPLHMGAVALTHEYFKHTKNKPLIRVYLDYVAEESKKDAERLKVKSESGNGEWMRFPSLKNDPVNFDNNVATLSGIAQNTNWCTKTAARSQLTGGDFYVYMTDNKTKPRLGVRLEDDIIAETRGILNEPHQGIETEMEDVLDKFIDEQGLKYSDRVAEVREKIKTARLFRKGLEGITDPEKKGTAIQNIVDKIIKESKGSESIHITVPLDELPDNLTITSSKTSPSLFTTSIRFENAIVLPENITIKGFDDVLFPKATIIPKGLKIHKPAGSLMSHLSFDKATKIEEGYSQSDRVYLRAPRLAIIPKGVSFGKKNGISIANSEVTSISESVILPSEIKITSSFVPGKAETPFNEHIASAIGRVPNIEDLAIDNYNEGMLRIENISFKNTSETNIRFEGVNLNMPLIVKDANLVDLNNIYLPQGLKGNAQKIELFGAIINGGDVAVTDKIFINRSIISDNLKIIMNNTSKGLINHLATIAIDEGKKLEVIYKADTSCFLGGKHLNNVIPKDYNVVKLYPNPLENNQDYIRNSSFNNTGKVKVLIANISGGYSGKNKIGAMGVSKTEFSNGDNISFAANSDLLTKRSGRNKLVVQEKNYFLRDFALNLSDVTFSNKGRVDVVDNCFEVFLDNAVFNNTGKVYLQNTNIGSKAKFNNKGSVEIKKLAIAKNGIAEFNNKGMVEIRDYELGDSEKQKIIFKNDGDVYIRKVLSGMEFMNSGKVYHIVTNEEISPPITKQLKEKINKLSAVEKAKKELGKLPDKASALPLDFYAKQLNNLRIIGQDILQRGFNKFVTWGKKFIEELGQAVKPFARKVWNEITNKKLFPDKDVNVSGISMEGIKKVADKIKTEFRNYDYKNLSESVKAQFRSRGKMTPDTYEAYNRMKGKFNASKEILEKDIATYKKVFKKEIEGKSKEEQRQIIEDGFKYLTDSEGRNRGEYSNLSREFRKELMKMRLNTDALSTKLAELPFLSEELSDIIINNVGEYMHRFYESDHNPKWKDYIMKTPEGQELYKSAKEKMIKEYQDAINATDDTKLKQQYAYALNNIDHYLLGMLEPSGGVLNELFARKRKIGRADTGMLKRRGELPEEYRKLKGEIRDPVANYVRTIYKLTNYINAHKFLSELRAQEYNKSFFDKRTINKDGDFTVLLAKGTDKQFTPLTHGKDIYTSKAIAESLQETFAPKEFGKIANMYFVASGLIKIGKTAYSPITIARNATSNVPMLLANGHTNFNKLGHSAKVVFSKDSKYMAERLDGLKYGVIGESASGGELSATVKDAFHSIDDISNLLDNTAKRHVINSHNKVVKSYSGVDDVSKYTAWLSEQERYSKAFKDELANGDMSKEDIKKITASIVSNTMPSYGRAVPIVRNLLRRLPLGNFVTFPAEIIRTSFNILQQAGKEMDNPKTNRIGKDRLKGLVGVTVISSTVLPMVARLLSGVSNEEEDAARIFMPEYQRNSQFIWLNKNRYIDLSYEDPYNYLKRGIVSIITGINDKKKVGTIIADAVAEYLRPFTEVEIAAKVLTAMATGWDSEKQERIWLDSDTWGDRAMKMADFALGKSQPGVTALGQRLYKSFSNEGNEFKSYNPVEEMLSITGLRVSTLDVPKSFYFASVRIKNAFKDITDRYHKDIKNDPDSKLKIAENVKESLNSQVEIAKKYVESAKTLGLTDKQITEVMKKAGVPNRHMETILHDKPIDIESDRGEKIYGKPEEEEIPKQKKIEEEPPIKERESKTLNERFKMLDKNKNRLNRDSFDNQLKGLRLDRGTIKERLKKQSLNRGEIKKQLQLR